MTTHRPKLVSIILSFRNEAENIPELIARTRAIFSNLETFNYELVFVNDASDDDSLKILLKYRQEDSAIKIIDMSRNFGHMVCVYAGLEACRGDAAIYMDCDLQDPPELIPRLVNVWDTGENVDVVFTTRLSRVGESWIRKTINKLGYRILRYTSDIPIPLDSGDFKLLSRRAIDLYLLFREQRPFFRFLVTWLGLNQVRIEYHREPRYAGRSKYLSMSILSNFLELALIPFSEKPLRLALLLGFLTSIFAFLYLGLLIVQKFMGMHIPGWTALMAVQLISAGIQLIVLGILGLYIGAIYKESVKRPRYIAKEKYGID